MKALQFYSVKERMPKHGENVMMIVNNSFGNLLQGYEVQTATVDICWARLEADGIETGYYTGGKNMPKKGNWRKVISMNDHEVTSDQHYVTHKDWSKCLSLTLGG
jgi:DNA-binding PadR family transcriptional regulator